VKPRGIDFFVYNVSDLARSADFCENTLGLTLKSWEGPGWVEFAVGSTQTVLALRLDPEGAGAAVQGGAIAVAVAVDDVG
jgi:catechol 2,3-dioxygenase-like lactoylglutathione lyase family enzyme